MSIPQELLRQKHVWLWLLIFIVIISGGLAVYLFRTHAPTRKKAVKDLALQKPLVLLLIGVDVNVLSPESQDNPKALTRTDTLILAILNPYRYRVSMVSIPRDSLVNIPGHGMDRINSASVLGGYSLTKRVVTELTGYKIDHYAVVNFESFRHLVDLLGGVQVNVDKKMRYADEYGHYTIKLDPGWQSLNGDRALQYVRFRNEPLGDISRVTRQRNLLTAVFKKMTKPAYILKWPQLLKVARQYIVTDLSTEEIFTLLNFARKIKDPNARISTYTLPGNFYEYYWKPDPVQVADLMNKLKPKPLPPVKKHLKS